ncbi:DUF305 domain-containing protein [Rhodohalobacter sp. SW132]|nr:DUF305 domain-containing protein [Rhodohalobacter sp. SW132]
MFLSMRFTTLPVLFISIILLLSFHFMGCAGSEQIADNETVEHSPDRNLSSLEEIYWARIDSSRMNFTQADVVFMTGMIGHHAQALIMSRLAPENDASRSVQVLAARIINAQGDEIRLMQQWLADRNQPVPEVHIDGLNLMIHMPDMEHNGGGHHGHHDHHGGMHDHSDMPGMLTQEQLEELAEAQGREFDRLFLLYMIEHHEGAITMVETLFNANGAAGDREMFDLASGINAEQITEINRMQSMLEEMEGS